MKTMCRTALAGLTALASTACQPDLTLDEEVELRALQLRPADVPPSTTNHVADLPGAAELGRHLFFDERMSADGKVGCDDCHDPQEGFSDSRPLSLGVFDREGGRHSMPITSVAFQTFLFWDGRADSLWSQPLQAIESDKEMDFTRVEVAHFVFRAYRTEYEELFGALPDLSGLPARARPGMPAWDAMTAAQKDDVQRIFSNVGKALEAYQRRLVCADTRFDRWARGEIDLDEDERAGAATFLREGCVECHAGPSFSDGKFHNIGIGSGTEEPDRGRATAGQRLRDDPFNGAGLYSDDAAAGAAILEAMVEEADTEGAFRTPSLRGVGQRRFFGHRGHRERLGDFVDDVYDDPHMQSSAVGELDPDVRGVEADGGSVVAFLRALDCPEPPADLLEP